MMQIFLMLLYKSLHIYTVLYKGAHFGIILVVPIAILVFLQSYCANALDIGFGNIARLQNSVNSIMFILRICNVRI